jgi:small conductance mechanosensitive channel
MRILRKTWFKYAGLYIFSILLIFLCSTPAWGQLIDLNKILKQHSTVKSKRIGNLDVVMLSLDGRDLFRLAAPAPELPDQDITPIKWRIYEINFKLKNLLDNGFNPDTFTMKVARHNQQTIILLEDQQNVEAPRPILTVTEQDAFIDIKENTISKVAERRAKILETALRLAWKERQPDYQQQQLRYSALLLVSMVVALVIIQKTINRYHHQSNQLKSKLYQQKDAKIRQIQSLQKNTVDLESKQNLEDISNNHEQKWLSLLSLNWEQQVLINRSVRYGLVVLQMAIIFVGSAWILNGFPETRSFGRWLGTLPLSLILIPITVILVKGIVDWIIVLTLNRFITFKEETQTLSKRFQLRFKTILNVLQDLTSYIAWLFGLMLFFMVINALSIGLIILALAALASQNLFKDWLRGCLILIEDHYAIGDIVIISSIKGKVEFMNLRVTQLRTLDGKLVSIDNGSFQLAENLTSGWSGIELIINVAYNTNMEEAKEIIEEIAQEMENDLDWGQYLIEAPQILGIEAFGENSIQIALLIKTEPGKQWEIAREYRLRLKPAFERAGISIPFPQCSIWFENALLSKPPE